MNRTNKVWMIYLLCLTLLLTSLCACEKPVQQEVDKESGTNAELSESTEAADSDEPVKPDLESTEAADSDEPVQPDVTDNREWSKRY